MNEKPLPRGPAFFNQLAETPSTLRSLKAAAEVPPDDLAQHPVYVQPLPLARLSDHKTLEIQTVKLAQDIDPRKLPTELRLSRPRVPPRESDWPLSAGVVASQPPLAARRRSRAWVFIGVFLSLLLMLLGRGLLLGARTAAQVASAGQPPSLTFAAKGASEPAVVEVSARPLEPPASHVPSVAEATHSAASSAAASSAAASSAAASASAVALANKAAAAPSAHARDVVELPLAKRVYHVPSQRELSPTPASQELAPAVSKPKRAIY